jgi:hypothetical protein
MFEFARSSLFFEQLEAAHPTIVQGIEIVYANKVTLDGSYHNPKNFCLSLNNLLMSILFFVESAQKNSSTWFKNAVDSFLDEHQDDFQKIRHLRNVSAHQKLIVPSESMSLGLYRIRSANHYTAKLNFGSQQIPMTLAPDLALRETADVFNDLLVFPATTFMDLEHSAFGECLGITRWWLFKVHFKTRARRYNEVVDVYDLASSFSMGLITRVCEAYAASKSIKFPHVFQKKLEEHNHINTLLEIDLYPSLFSKWWDAEATPLNFGVLRDLGTGSTVKSVDDFYTWAFKGLTSTPDEYASALESIAALDVDQVFKNENARLFMSYILVNRWHYQRAFGTGLGDRPVCISDVMKLQRAGRMFLDEQSKGKQCTILSTKANLDSQIRSMVVSIKSAQADSAPPASDKHGGNSS